jgi:glycosyltransferase involved in cell wall biosynthesis
MTDQGRSSIAILFWGTRGGPVRQINNYFKIAELHNLDFHWLISNNMRDGNFDFNSKISHIRKFHLPQAKIGILFNIFLKQKIIKETIKHLEVNQIQRIFILLPHPWDISLSKKIKKSTSIEIWRGVHDLKRHPGDRWPTDRSIRNFLKFADAYVTFSPFVTSMLAQRNKLTVQTTIEEPRQFRKVKPKQNTVLFVGRIRKYKGLDLLKKAWPMVSAPDKFLTIAGEGRGIPFKQSKSIQLINRWLSESDIENLIENHKVLVLPYVEASQSGIIPIAISRGVPVVVTPVGGLSGQVIHGINGLVSNSLSPDDIAAAIDLALASDWSPYVEEDMDALHFLKRLKVFDSKK